MKIKPFEPIEIVWKDANSPYKNEWATVDEHTASVTEMEIHSIGYFIEQKDGYIRIVADISESSLLETVVNRPLNIPLSDNVKIKRLRRPKK